MQKVGPHFGQLGDGSIANVAGPRTPLGFDASVVSVTLGQYHVCALQRLDGSQKLFCWGDNSQGQLGIGSNSGPEYCATGLSCSRTPRLVAGFGDEVVSLSAHATNSHSCLATSSRTVYCWGDNTFGQLGLGVLGSNEPLPRQVAGLPGDADQVATGYLHTCAIRAGYQKLSCWGYNRFGALGFEGNDFQPSPVEVFSLLLGPT